MLGVLVTHIFSPLIGRGNAFTDNLIVNGARGVQLFFIISAFTLFLSLETKKTEKAVTRNFFIRRFFRIAPMFYIMIPIYLLVFGLGPRYWLGDAGGISGWNIAATALFVNGWNPHWINSVMGINWTIAIEMSFYLLVPLLFKYIKNLFDALALFFGAGILLVFINPPLLAHNPIGSVELWNNFTNLWLPSQFAVFALGIVLYFLIFPDKNQKITFVRTRLWITVGLLIAAAFGLLIYNQLAVVSPFSLLFLGFAYLLAMKPLKLLVNRATRHIGKISYSFYLTHLLVLNLVYALLHKASGAPHSLMMYAVIFSLTLLLTTALSSLTYKYIEKPGIIFGNKLIEKLEKGEEIYLTRMLKRLNPRRRISPVDRDTW